MSLIAANLKIELLTWPDRKKLNLSNGDFIVSIRSSVGDIEAEMRVTSNSKSEKNAIIDYFPCFCSHPFHVERPRLYALWPRLQMAAEKKANAWRC